MLMERSGLEMSIWWVTDMVAVAVIVAIVVVAFVVVVDIIGSRNSGGSGSNGGGEVVLLTMRLGVGGHWSRSLFSPVFLYFSEAERARKEGGGGRTRVEVVRACVCLSEFWLWSSQFFGERESERE